ncbi:MAG TPA: gamma-glutamylcyclotransferase family protein [Beijerinckiaceae bacterium]|jgi:hypothetical protein
MPLYFAYGSNMDLAAMRARCPASRPVGIARLPRHRLVIVREGYASVVRDPRRTVFGVLWDLALADVPALDRYEAVASRLYVKTSQPVLTDRGPKRALIYVATGAAGGPARPGYVEAVIAAAGEAGLPAAYLKELAALLPPGAARAGKEVDAEPAAAKVRPRWASPLQVEPDGL